MKQLIISFSGRRNGNCDQISFFIAAEHDKIVYFRELDIHACSNCEYQCFRKKCQYRNDDIYHLYDEMLHYDRVILIVPMYCGNPSALYFIFNERSQDYFMHNDTYGELLQKLYIIGIYGSSRESPEFLSSLSKWFDGTQLKNHVIGIERHLYGQKMEECILEVAEVRLQIKAFLNNENHP